MTRGVVLSFAVLLALFEIGACMRCYQCNSQADPACRDEFHPEQRGRFLVDCSVDNSYNRVYLRDILPSHLTEGVTGAPKYCAKIVTRTGTTVRTCLDANPLDPNQTCRALERSAYDYGQTTQQIQYCNICDRDLCNGSNAFTASLPLLALLALISFLSFKQ